jgi:hypothetical protein
MSKSHWKNSLRPGAGGGERGGGVLIMKASGDILQRPSMAEVGHSKQLVQHASLQMCIGLPQPLLVQTVRITFTPNNLRRWCMLLSMAVNVHT